MTQFDSEQTAGEQRYVADGGNNSYNAGWDLVKTLSGNLIDGFVNDVAAPFQSPRGSAGTGSAPV